MIDKRSLRCGLLLCALASRPSPLTANECESVGALPLHSRAVEAARLAVPSDATVSKMFSFESRARRSFLELRPEGFGGLWVLWTSAVGGIGIPICVRQGTSRDLPATYVLENHLAPRALRIRLTLSPGASIKLALHSNGIPATAADRPGLPDTVGLPVDVVVFEGAALGGGAERHVAGAAEIWSRAGVVLTTGSVRRLSKVDSDRILKSGTIGALDTYLGCSQRFDEPGFGEREQLFRSKRNPRALTIFFVRTTTQSQAEREFLQVYMDNDPGSQPGRTLAHEIGHLLLGEGHTGGQRGAGECDRMAAASAIRRKERAPWSSGLMRAGNESEATDISVADSATARATALTMSGAVYW